MLFRRNRTQEEQATFEEQTSTHIPKVFSTIEASNKELITTIEKENEEARATIRKENKETRETLRKIAKEFQKTFAQTKRKTKLGKAHYSKRLMNAHHRL